MTPPPRRNTERRAGMVPAASAGNAWQAPPQRMVGQQPGELEGLAQHARIGEQRAAQRTLAQATQERPVARRMAGLHHGMCEHGRRIVAHQHHVALEHRQRSYRAQRPPFVGQRQRYALRQPAHAELWLAATRRAVSEPPPQTQRRRLAGMASSAGSTVLQPQRRRCGCSCAGPDAAGPVAAELQHLVEIVGELADAVVAALDQRTRTGKAASMSR